MVKNLGEIKRICANCIYFHSWQYKGKFGGCGVTVDHEKRAFSDGCVDFSDSDPALISRDERRGEHKEGSVDCTSARVCQFRRVKNGED